MAITVTETARGKIAEVLAGDGREAAFFRVAVEGGGCKGFSYRLGIDVVRGAGDVELSGSEDGPTVLVDETSAVLLDGAQIDWKSSIAEEKFVLSNPNATSSCGCGTSFSL